jgi:hypothetical protein
VAANTYQAVKQATQDLIAPQMESLKGGIGAVRADIGAVHSEGQALRSEMHVTHAALVDKRGTEIRRVDEKLSTEIRRIEDKITWALALRERIVAIEARLGPTTPRS